MSRLLLIPAAAITLSSCGWFHSGNGNAIRLSGNIELTQVNISFKIAGRLIERAVTEGDPVKKGMVVARLDKEQLLAQRDRAKAALDSSDSLLVQQRTSIEWQDETLEAQIQQRQAEVRNADARLAELLAGSRTQEKEQARAAVERTQTEYDRSANDWKRAQTLFKNEDISAADHDQYRTRYESADAQLKSAKEQLAMVLEGPRKETIAQAQAMLGQTRATLRQAEAQRIELKRRKEEIATRLADIAARRADVQIVATQLADTEATSPIDGVVLVKAAEPGEILAAGTTVVTVGDIHHPWVRAYLSELDYGRVKLGDKVKVTTDSFPGKVYWGRVSFISSEAEFTPKQIQTQEERSKLVYRVKIEVENPNQELKSNMPADAEILINQ
jgi:HlyD family secretion protein